MKPPLAGSFVLWFLGSSVLAHSQVTYSYWVQPCVSPESKCQKDDSQLAQWAIEAWQHASHGGIHFVAVKDREPAQIRLVWASEQQGMYGEARPIVVEGKRGAEVYVRPAPMRAGDDHLLRDAIVYMTCLHETGHALGLVHTAAFDVFSLAETLSNTLPAIAASYRSVKIFTGFPVFPLQTALNSRQPFELARILTTNKYPCLRYSNDNSIACGSAADQHRLQSGHHSRSPRARLQQ